MPIELLGWLLVICSDRKVFVDMFVSLLVFIIATPKYLEIQQGDFH